MSKFAVVFCRISIAYVGLYFSTSKRMLEVVFCQQKETQKLRKKAGIKMQVLEAVLDLPSYITNLKILMNSER